MQHKYIQSLRIVDANGNDKVDGLTNTNLPVGGNVVFEAGANMALASEEAITFDAGYGLKPPSAEMLAKWKAVINGGSGVAHGVSYSFRTGPFTPDNFYYIASIDGKTTLDGFSFIGVDKCYHTGQFLDYTTPETTPNSLTLLDTCPACVDCPEYFDINRYLDTIHTAYDSQKDNLLDAEAMLDQYIGLIEKWNYIVNLKSWRYNAEARGGEIYASCKYTNHTDSAIPPGMTMTIDFSNAPPNSRAFFIDTAVKGFTRSSCLISKTSDTTVVLTTQASLPKGSGIRFYCGNLSPYYTGFTTRAQIDFSLAFPSGGIGTQTTSFNTNLMVAIDPDTEIPPWDDGSES